MVGDGAEGADAAAGAGESAAAGRRRTWAPDLTHRTVDCGHFMAEESLAKVVKALRELLAR